MLNRRHFTRLSLFSLGLGLANCTTPTKKSPSNSVKSRFDADLTIWWEQGFLPEENERVTQIVRGWEKLSGLTVNLKLLPVDLIDQQLSQLVTEPGNPHIPDIVYSVGLDTNLAPKLAWQDQLFDLSEVILPIKDRYTPVALFHVNYRNQVRGERGYYALPLWQAEDYIHYWGNLVETIGFSPADVPMTWEPFWKFWQTAQTQLRSRGYPDIYGIGLCMSSIGFDTYTSLMMFLDAYNVEVVTPEGEFSLEDPQNRQRMIAALDEFTRFFTEGYVPPSALEWTGGGNNSSFIDGDILMTQNLTLSIPLTQQLPASQYNQDAARRYQQIVTIERPQKPDGTNLLTRKGIKQAIVPKACPHPETAKNFLAYLVEPKNINQLITGFKGRVMPVMPQLFENSLWSNTSDPHLAAALKIYNRPSLIPYEVTHPAFSEVQSQQLWAKTVLKVLQDKDSTTEASDWVINQIKTIWTKWEQSI
ncbi:carbohydrate ABC transporter substrate-binding protein [Limnothrix sp. FACHB-708]|uniref:ABC transporter substrate-binding protein n=1 Tax=unclassified Limnothrix TaxID=2632864 RepID=UPI0016832F6A|nr:MULTISPECIES: ABC transporter substrate-binding protein [unclassified Limnothrix]MBD2552280.1 carbohydrate ABC transporter substrate-binding protein [Limnothrix sp. FACHB-708]MBD2590147.1 carbohydrate ABC transporter substrate-binding protein [Limnothrix sp. FACHB-406]